MNQGSRYIFLDIDGVLTNMHEIPGSFINHNVSEYGLSPSCVKRFLQFAEETDSKVIISSNWRKFPKDGYWHHLCGDFKNHMPELIEMLKGRYVGDLPKDRHLRKSEALDMWFKQNNLSPQSLTYVIFDDDKRELFQESQHSMHLVLTDAEWGITDLDVQKAKEILNC